VSQFEETASGAKAQFHFYGRFGTTKVVPCYKAIQIETLPEYNSVHQSHSPAGFIARRGVTVCAAFRGGT
jgi:hypothetical protein